VGPKRRDTDRIEIGADIPAATPAGAPIRRRYRAGSSALVMTSSAGATRGMRSYSL
jgi:hypothetical protein